MNSQVSTKQQQNPSNLGNNQNNYQEENFQNNKKNNVPMIIFGIIVFFIIGIVGFVFLTNVSNNDSESNENNSSESDTFSIPPSNDNTQNSSNLSSEIAETPTNSSDTFRSGSYSETIIYAVPDGFVDRLTVNVDLSSDGTIESVSLSEVTSNEESEEHFSDFEGAYFPLVANKNIEDVNLSRVAGASLTSEAFMEALGNIIDDAQV